MQNLIRAEFRKILTTKVWWGLLIPTVLVALAWSLTTGSLGKAFIDFTNRGDVQQLETMFNIDSSNWKVSVFGIARSINVATVFPMIFGGLAISSEIHKKTITTTFLTAQSRVAALAAKMVTYLIWSLIYGVAIVGFVMLGMVLTSHPESLPSGPEWIELCGTGILETVLVTLFGVGIGALIGNVVGTTLTLTLYMLIGENLILVLLPSQVPHLAGFLPNESADGIVGSIASDVFLNGSDVHGAGIEFTRALAGGAGAFDWWISGLIFLVWTGLAFGGGWLLSQKRDIT